MFACKNFDIWLNADGDAGFDVNVCAENVGSSALACALLLPVILAPLNIKRAAPCESTDAAGENIRIINLPLMLLMLVSRVFLGIYGLWEHRKLKASVSPLSPSDGTIPGDNTRLIFADFCNAACWLLISLRILLAGKKSGLGLRAYSTLGTRLWLFLLGLLAAFQSRTFIEVIAKVDTKSIERDEPSSITVVRLCVCLLTVLIGIIALFQRNGPKPLNLRTRASAEEDVIPWRDTNHSIIGGLYFSWLSPLMVPHPYPTFPKLLQVLGLPLLTVRVSRNMVNTILFNLEICIIWRTRTGPDTMPSCCEPNWKGPLNCGLLCMRSSGRTCGWEVCSRLHTLLRNSANPF